METWEELNPDEKDELASVFSGHLHDLVVSAILPKSVHAKHLFHRDERTEWLYLELYCLCYPPSGGLK